MGVINWVAFGGILVDLVIISIPFDFCMECTLN